MNDFSFDLDTDYDFDVNEFDANPDIVGFDADRALPTTAEQTRILNIKRYPRPYTVRYEYAAELANGINHLDEGECVYGIVSGNFIFGDFIEAYVVDKNYYAEEMMIATLSLGQENVDSLANLLDGDYVGAMTLVVSDFWYAHERRKDGGVPYIMDVLGRHESFRFAAAGVHTKVCLIKTSCGKSLVMHGSSNLRSSRNIEQFCMENNPVLYDFNREWINRIAENFRIKGKSIRASALWKGLIDE